MRILLTGGTGFVGTAVREELLRLGHHVRLLVRTRSHEKWKHLEEDQRLELVQGDVTDLVSMKRACHLVDAVVHLVGIVREGYGTHESYEFIHIRGTETVLEAAADNNVMWILYMSALGTRPDAQNRFHKTKYAAERAVVESGLGYLILRPSIIWGDNDHFTTILRKKIVPHAPALVPGTGKKRYQPVYIKDLARGLAKSLDIPALKNKILEVGGPERLTFGQLVDAIAEDKGVERYLKIPVPPFLSLPATAVLQYVPFFPLTLEMLKMLNEDNVTEDTTFWDSVGIKPRRFMEKSVGNVK